jgi:gliding motility-associated-like protein
LWSNFATTNNPTGLAAGNYTVTVTDAAGCTTSKSFVLTQPPLLVSNAGPNEDICGINSDTLAADPPAFGTGYWMVVSGSGTFVDSTQHNTVVTNLTNGVNVFQWVVTDGVCSVISQVVINFNTQITASPGSSREICDDSFLLTATAPSSGSGYWQVINSNGIIDDSSKAVTMVTGLNPGANIFRWFVVNGLCTDSADINIFVKDPDECFTTIEVPTGFTPNDDGHNDYFIVLGIEEFPDNAIVVYNRWGNKVYEKSSYRNEWNGNNNSGDPLPAGTYFVILKIRKLNKTMTSYVDLRR